MGDVHDKRGSDFVVERRVDNLEWPVRRQLGNRMWLRTSVRQSLAQLVQAGHEYSFIAECGRSVVVRMASLPVGQDHHSRTLLANHLRDLQAVFPGVLYAAVGNIQSLPETYL